MGIGRTLQGCVACGRAWVGPDAPSWVVVWREPGTTEQQAALVCGQCLTLEVRHRLTDGAAELRAYRVQVEKEEVMR